LVNVLKGISRILWLIAIKYHRRYKKWKEKKSGIQPTNEGEDRPNRITIEVAPVENLDNSRENRMPDVSFDNIGVRQEPRKNGNIFNQDSPKSEIESKQDTPRFNKI
jgi:hypothetical protein